jgi:hypothetical protein
MKRLYVALMRRLRSFARATGLLSLLERRLDRMALLYLRSLFSIHDVEDMIRLDLPWWTFTATRYLESYLQQRAGAAEVFEYGPGASTVWLAKRARRVAYVENDEEFAAMFEPLLTGVPNVRGTCVPPEPADPSSLKCPSGRKGYQNVDFSSYVAAIRSAGAPFDVIVIDGRARSACLEEALKHLKPGGIILFDNSGRSRYRRAIEAAALRETRFRGLTPGLPYPEQTSVLSASDRR